ncbi:MAG: hypothetical protein NTV22_05370 [bacterium]|nr:hypothetical protein [bacterium]
MHTPEHMLHLRDEIRVADGDCFGSLRCTRDLLLFKQRCHAFLSILNILSKQS